MNAQEQEKESPTKWLPVAFVGCCIGGLYLIYVIFHCIPLLQLDLPSERQDAHAKQRGLIEILVFHGLTFMLLLCYFRCITVHPGEIPKGPQWDWEENDKGRDRKDSVQERKRDGERRWCKWCKKYKPDRCHHCRVCKKCVLKMDHHCPWIYNCVGFRNHKYFFLLLFYTVLSCHLIMWSMIESVTASIEVDTPFGTMFFLLFGETLAWFLGMLVTAFFGFHVWLVMKAMTTIEFCEKSLKKGSEPAKPSPYDLGPGRNLLNVLGSNVLLWLLPFNATTGDGTKFESSEHTPLTSYEQGRGHKKWATKNISAPPPRSGRGDMISSMSENSRGFSEYDSLSRETPRSEYDSLGRDERPRWGDRDPARHDRYHRP